MNSFEAKYIKLSAEYLQDKLDKLNTKTRAVYKIEDKKESKLSHIISSLFKS
jgi:hypothetical protein